MDVADLPRRLKASNTPCVLCETRRVGLPVGLTADMSVLCSSDIKSSLLDDTVDVGWRMAEDDSVVLAMIQSVEDAPS